MSEAWTSAAGKAYCGTTRRGSHTRAARRESANTFPPATARTRLRVGSNRSSGSSRA
ncbi:hypothetical protein [Amycolatopsis methanolica]|uniref:hypothetical protein n=1 Tax=Amycolatopsis methanolica TaxID=1814 RepID=UPI003416CF80